MSSLLTHGDTFSVCEGSLFRYKAIGPVCRLFDREELPWPSCSLQWRGKMPSWNRQGSRFTRDIGAKNSPSYSARLVGHKVSKVFIVNEGGECVLNTFVNQVTGEYPDSIPSQILQQISYDREPIPVEQLRTVPPRDIVLTQYSDRLDANVQRWWQRNTHYHPGKDYSVA
jgi:hypothetical protein